MIMGIAIVKGQVANYSTANKMRPDDVMNTIAGTFEKEPVLRVGGNPWGGFQKLFYKSEKDKCMSLTYLFCPH